MKKFAHKVAYIAGGIIIGVVFSTSAGAFADTVKSMVGKKVTGEYTIVVDGKKLSDKGAVIDSRANVPARALSEALGADVKVSGKTITITSEEETVDSGNTVSNSNNAVSNKYSTYSKSSLEELKESTLRNVLGPLKTAREQTLAALEELKSTGNTEAATISEKRLAEYDADIAKYEADLKLIEEALATAK